MTGLLIAALISFWYAAGWVITAALVARFCANKCKACPRSNYSSYRECSHLSYSAHWRGDGTIGRREAQTGGLTALGWPLLFLPLTAYWLATRKPTPRGLQTRITELERELEMDR